MLMRFMRKPLGICQNVPNYSISEFIKEQKIDFVCHDDLPYITTESDDAYYIPKKMGKFKATKRT